MKLAHKLYAYSGIAAASASLAMAGTAHAASANNGPFSTDNTIAPPSNTGFGTTVDGRTAIAAIANTIFNIVMLVAAILAVLYLIWSGIQYITAGGNADKTKAARAGIINAVIGIIVILAAFFIVRLAISFGRTADQTSINNDGIPDTNTGGGPPR